MRCPRRFLFASLIVAIAAPAMAQMVFARETVRIDPAPASMAAKSKALPHAPLSYDVEVRGEDALKLEYIHTLNTLGDGSGVMIVFASPAMVPLPAMKVYTPVDALFVADSGQVVQILPSVTLGDLTQQVMAHAPVKALLFLKAGQVAARGLQPRDTVAGSMFTPAPPVME